MPSVIFTSDRRNDIGAPLGLGRWALGGAGLLHRCGAPLPFPHGGLVPLPRPVLPARSAPLSPKELPPTESQSPTGWPRKNSLYFNLMKQKENKCKSIWFMFDLNFEVRTLIFLKFDPNIKWMQMLNFEQAYYMIWSYRCLRQIGEF